MSSIFQECLGNFVKNFGYGDSVRHLFQKGYTSKRILREFDYPYSLEELEKIRTSMEKNGNKQPKDR